MNIKDTPLIPITAERVLLGSLMLSPSEVWPELQAREIAEGSFATEAHRLIFRAIAELIEADGEVDPILVSDVLVRDDKIKKANGLDYLDELTQGIPRTTNATYYAGIVQGAAISREIAAKGARLQSLAKAGRDPMKILAKVREWVDLAEKRMVTSTAVTLAETLPATVASIRHGFENPGKRPQGMQTGLAALDDFVESVVGGDLVIIGGRPSMGKTALAGPIIHQVAINHGPVAVFCFESDDQKMNKRWLSMMTGVNLKKLRTGRGLNAYEMAQIERVAERDVPPVYWFRMTDTAATAEGVRLGVEAAMRTRPLSLIVVDHLHLMHVAGRSKDRNTELSLITRRLKCLANEKQVPLILLAQLNRGVEQRSGKDKRPRLSDLRDCGSIEQDADIVLFPYRSAYDQQEEPVDQVCEIIVAKNKEGPRGSVEIGFHAPTATFYDLGGGTC